jgi:maltose alpha-D-glucosyltransferase/alpha-amylase
MKALSEPAATLAERLLSQRDAIVRSIEGLRTARFDGVKTRHHGDFHLGQVLVAKDDAYILDFEGEPKRSLDERRRKEPPARDVAGFLRSIDYAASAAMSRAPSMSPEEALTLSQRLRAWADDLSAGYWDCYRETLGEARLWPADEAQSKELLALFLLEKAFYEIDYELTNRPSWSHIPLEATLRILEQRGAISR